MATSIPHPRSRKTNITGLPLGHFLHQTWTLVQPRSTPTRTCVSCPCQNRHHVQIWHLDQTWFLNQIWYLNCPAIIHVQSNTFSTLGTRTVTAQPKSWYQCLVTWTRPRPSTCTRHCNCTRSRTFITQGTSDQCLDFD